MPMPRPPHARRIGLPTQGGCDESTRVPRPRTARLGGRADPRSAGRRRRDRARSTTSTICGTDLHILKGDVPEVTAGHDPRPRSRRHRRRESAPPSRPSRSATACSSRASRRAAAAASARKRRYGLCTGGAAGSSATLIDGAAGGVRARPVRGHLGVQGPGRAERRAGALPRRHPPDRVTRSASSNGRVEPGDTVAIVGAGPIGLAAIMTAKLLHARHDRRDRPRRRAPREGARVRRRRRRSTTAARTQSRR